ncbi:MAG: glutamate-5-semialdehyde dehydrogenase [Steroidobacteraceae bacterium]
MSDELGRLMNELGQRAVAAAAVLAGADRRLRDAALLAAAVELRAQSVVILEANALDLRAAEAAGAAGAMLDRLRLDGVRVEAMAAGLEAIAGLPDPLGRILEEKKRPNGLRIQRVSVPLGVIGIIYESRPNVTADAGSLCLKSGNAVILRGGSEAVHSNRAIHACLVAGLVAAGLPADCVQWVPTQDREAVGYLLKGMTDYLDVIVPRGGKGLISRVRDEARVPVIGHLDGNCHVYVHAAADVNMAREIVLNSKLRRTGICGAAETVLFDRAVLATHAAPIVGALLDAGCEVRGDEAIQALDPRVQAATEDDWYTEYLDAIVAARAVDGVEAAIAHIGRYGSAHTESIGTPAQAVAAHFLAAVDSAIVLHNASTQFADGGEFGMGAEIGISTDRFHARGPVGLEQLVSYKYVVRGEGQVRPR